MIQKGAKFPSRSNVLGSFSRTMSKLLYTRAFALKGLEHSACIEFLSKKSNLKYRYALVAVPIGRQARRESEQKARVGVSRRARIGRKGWPKAAQ